MSALAPEDRRLVALAAVFVPARAEALAARLADGRGATLRQAASRAAKRTRSDRLAALRDEVLALREAIRDGAPERSRPALRRLLREQAARAWG